MNTDHHPRLFVFGGLGGIVGTLCYIAAITVPMGVVGTLIFSMAWPVLSIVFASSLFRFIGHERQSATNQLAFVFACLAFVLVAAMMSSQLAVVAGMQEYAEHSLTGEPDLLRLMQRSTRLVDMGIDVAWDLFIGTSLIFLSVALKGCQSFGIWWATPAILLGILLIVLNVITFPWPPNTRGLHDIGPAVGLYIIALSARLTFLGTRMTRTHLATGHDK